MEDSLEQSNGLTELFLVVRFTIMLSSSPLPTCRGTTSRRFPPFLVSLEHNWVQQQQTPTLQSSFPGLCLRPHLHKGQTGIWWWRIRKIPFLCNTSPNKWNFHGPHLFSQTLISIDPRLNYNGIFYFGDITYHSFQHENHVESEHLCSTPRQYQTFSFLLNDFLSASVLGTLGKNRGSFTKNYAAQS